MKNKLFFSKLLVTAGLFVHEQKVIAPVLVDGFLVLDQGPIWRNSHGQEAEEDQGLIAEIGGL